MSDRVYDDMGIDITEAAEYGKALALFTLANRERERRHRRLISASKKLKLAIDAAQAARVDLLDATRVCVEAARLVAIRKGAHDRSR